MQFLNLAHAEPGQRKQLAPALAEESFAYISALSDLLLKDARCRPFADLLALGFWLRPAHLQKILQPYRSQPYLLRPLGLVFHNAPANVDSLFMYPALLSLLMGNQNLIRLSSRAGGSAALLLTLINELAGLFPAVNQRLMFVRTAHRDAELTAWLQHIDGRLLWGSDAAIIAQRQTPVPAHCRDLTFAHKFSLCLLDANALLHCSDADLQAMQALFIRDHLSYAQQTCASAKLLTWLGEPAAVKQAQQRFWPALEQQQQLTDSEHFQALAAAQQLIAGSDNYQQLQLRPLIRLSAAALDPQMIELHPGCGLFIEMTAATLDELTPQLAQAHQTISYWGLDAALLASWQQQQLVGVDRLVPLGQSLQFHPIWDGMDLPLQLARVSLPLKL